MALFGNFVFSKHIILLTAYQTYIGAHYQSLEFLNFLLQYFINKNSKLVAT